MTSSEEGVRYQEQLNVVKNLDDLKKNCTRTFAKKFRQGKSKERLKKRTKRKRKRDGKKILVFFKIGELFEKQTLLICHNPLLKNCPISYLEKYYPKYVSPDLYSYFNTFQEKNSFPMNIKFCHCDIFLFRRKQGGPLVDHLLPTRFH